MDVTLHAIVHAAKAITGLCLRRCLDVRRNSDTSIYAWSVTENGIVAISCSEMAVSFVTTCDTELTHILAHHAIKSLPWYGLFSQMLWNDVLGMLAPQCIAQLRNYARRRNK